MAMGDGPMIPVVWLVNHPECWDQALLDDILSGRSWLTGYEFDHKVGIDALTGLDGAVVVIPGANQHGNARAVQEALSGLSWVLVLLTSDEERRFPLDALDHPNMRVWLQYPKEGDKADSYLPVGYPPHYLQHLAPLSHGKPEGWFWAGQVNHPRRKELATALRGMDGGSHVETPGFTQGLPHDAYALRLARAKFAPCPTGPESADSFRVAEALEAGCVPILDGAAPDADASWMWPLVYPGCPSPVAETWEALPDILEHLTEGWPANGTRGAAWWQSYKRRLARRLGDTVCELSGIHPQPGPVTVLIPTSPIVSHPDTSIIEQTIASVRHWLPDAEIQIMCDGVRPEQEHYRERYEEYLGRLVWLGARHRRIAITVHDEHLHQAEMTRRALRHVTSPLILFVEHDTPLVTDEPIDFPALIAAAQSGDADLIRFHFEAHVHPEHEHLMLDTEPRDVCGAPLLRTVQWSQRPHLANTGFYRRVLAENFAEGRKAMVEDVMHGVVHNDWREYGKAGWDRYRMWMYAPDGNIKRSLHLDGRGSDQKWEFG